MPVLHRWDDSDDDASKPPERAWRYDPTSSSESSASDGESELCSSNDETTLLGTQLQFPVRKIRN